MPDPLVDAEILLSLWRVLCRVRRDRERRGIHGADAAAARAILIGQRYAEALKQAKAASPEDQPARVAELLRVGEELWSEIDGHLEGIRCLVSELQAGVGGGHRYPSAPRRQGQ